MECCRFSATTLALLSLICLAWFSPRPLVAQDDGTEDTAGIEAARAKVYEALDREAVALERHSHALKTVAKLVQPTVVHIEAEKADPTGLQYRGKSAHVEEAGSGCIVKLGGRDYILTNRHVIKAASVKNIKIRFADGRQINPTRVWDNAETDVAVMSVDAPGLIAARLGNSDQVEIGDFVLAVGSPFGLSHSITFGIVSATGRWDLKLGEGVKFQHFIQTDAAINPGNSGGPLINLRGEVIGMNTAIASSSGGNEGIGFSIPINLAISIAKQLVERNGVMQGFLGVQLDGSFDSATAVSVGLKRTRGARIKDVTQGSPAAAAKLQPGDVVLDFGGVRVDNDSHLINLVNLTEVGREVPMVVFRDQRALKVMIKVGSAPSNLAAPKRQPAIGAKY
jgi:serine protease Do